MKCLILASLLSICLAAPAAQFTWKDCLPTTQNAAVTVHSLDLSPNPIIFPGDINVNINLTVNRQIDHLFIDVELIRKTLGGTGTVTVPCIGSTNIGTCQNIDACNILSDILNGTTVVSADLGKQIQAILLSSLGHQPQCPIMPEQVSVINTLTLQPIPTVLSVVADGDYNIKIKIKDDPTANDYVGCLEFDAGLKRKSTGFLFN